MQTNTIRNTLNVIGGKWKPLILCLLIDEGTKRHAQLMKDIPGVSQKVLTQQLRELEENNIIKRTIYPCVPPKVEYEITSYGETLKPLLNEMCIWGKIHSTKKEEF